MPTDLGERTLIMVPGGGDLEDLDFETRVCGLQEVDDEVRLRECEPGSPGGDDEPGGPALGLLIVEL